MSALSNYTSSKTYPRYKEIHLLKCALDEYCEVVLCGEAGVGKTWLVKNFIQTQSVYDNKLYFSYHRDNEYVDLNEQTFQNKKTLIIIDDIPVVSDFILSDSYQKLKSIGDVHFIFVTRDMFSYPKDFCVIKIHGLNLVETKEVIYELLDSPFKDNENLTKAIYECTNGHILFIKMLCLYINNIREDVDDIILQLKTFKLEDLLYRIESKHGINSATINFVKKYIEDSVDKQGVQILIDICAFSKIPYDTYCSWNKDNSTSEKLQKLKMLSLIDINADNIISINSYILKKIIWSAYSPLWSNHNHITQNMIDDLNKGLCPDEELYISLIKSHIKNTSLLDFITSLFQYKNGKRIEGNDIRDQMNSMLEIIVSYKDYFENMSQNIDSVGRDVKTIIDNQAYISNVILELKSYYTGHEAIEDLLSQIYDTITNKKVINQKKIFDVISLMGSFASIYSLPAVKNGIKELIGLLKF